MSEKQSIRLTGALAGGLRQAVCTIDDVRVSNSIPGVFAYTRPKIVWIDQDLPDGVYELRFGNQTEKVEKCGRDWLSR